MGTECRAKVWQGKNNRIRSEFFGSVEILDFDSIINPQPQPEECFQMAPNIEKLYRDVCFHYFPRWNPWELVFNPNPKLKNHGILGYCNVSERKIGLVRPSKAALIHEICHAITTKKHGTSWSYRMQKAIETARVKDPALVTELEGWVALCMSRRDVPFSACEHTVLNIIRDDAEFYRRDNEALDDLLLGKGFFPEFNPREYRRIRDNALRVIERAF